MDPRRTLLDACAWRVCNPLVLYFGGGWVVRCGRFVCNRSSIFMSAHIDPTRFMRHAVHSAVYSVNYIRRLSTGDYIGVCVFL